MPPAGMRSSAPAPDGLILAEHLVLGLITERPTHGFALAQLVAADGPIGRVYQVPRPIVYRSIDRLVAAGLVVPERVERSQRGPQRTVMRVTSRGRRELRDWLERPVIHVRDLRTELLCKLALLYRSGGDPQQLLAAQRRALQPIVDGLSDERRMASGFDQTILAWRFQSACAAMRFLDDVETVAPNG